MGISGQEENVLDEQSVTDFEQKMSKLPRQKRMFSCLDYKDFYTFIFSDILLLELIE